MLSRIANSLFWMGRYLERVEHMARFAKVQYFSSLDAPVSINKKRILTSMIAFNGLPPNFCNIVDEEVLFHISISAKNGYSMLSTLNAARENARGARDVLSSELWESINTYFNKLKAYSQKPFDTDDFIDIVILILDNSAIVKGLIDNTLFHRDERALICEGLHLERAIQINRITLEKLKDIETLEEDSNVKEALELFHWGTLLKCAESFDMCHRYYSKVPNRKNSLEFLLLNDEFPKSVLFNLQQATRHLARITKHTKEAYQSPEYELGKVASEVKYTSIKQIDKHIHEYLNQQLSKLYAIAGNIENKYLSY